MLNRMIMDMFPKKYSVLAAKVASDPSLTYSEKVVIARSVTFTDTPNGHYFIGEAYLREVRQES